MDVGAVPETIDGDWDRFYLEFPHLYDRFALTSVAVVPALARRYPFAGAVVLDVASGTGRSTFALAASAGFVVGLEPWDSMRAFARRRMQVLGIDNVAFVRGAAETLPFARQSVDHVVSVYGFPLWFPEAGEHGRELGRRFLADCRRIVKPGGWVVTVEGAPNLYAGELTPIVAASRLSPAATGLRDGYMVDLGFHWWDLDVEADYGTVDEAVATYGLIYGRRAIEHLRANNISRIKWKLRVQEVQIDG